jgi:tetratricopeptide (TPR) repeat protein
MRPHDAALAVRLLDQAIALQPTAARYVARGGAKLMLHDLSGAEGDTKSALERDGNLAEAHALECWVDLQREAVADARRACDAALTRDGSSRNALSGAIAGAQRARAWDDVVRYVDRALAIERVPMLYEVRSRANVWLGRDEEAVADARKGLVLDPSNMALHNDLAWTLRSLGRIDEALPEADRAVVLAPDEEPPHGTRCWVRLDAGDRTGALEDCARANVLRPSCHVEAGMLAFLHGDMAAARTEWAIAVGAGDVVARELEPWRSRANATP